MTTLKFNTPVGYTLAQRNVRVDLDTAIGILKSRKHKNYLSAHRSGFEMCAELRKDIWKCPYCYQEQPVRRVSEQNSNKNLHAGEIRNISNTLIDQWGSRQFSFFGNDIEDILIMPVPVIDGEQRCPKCKRKSLPSSVQQEVLISYDSEHVVLKTVISNISEFLAIPWGASGSISLRFPINEVVTFDLQKGRTFIELQGENADSIAKLDITDRHSAWKKSLLYQLLRDNIVISRTVRHIFSEMLDGRMPFGKNELSPDKYILLTQFTGFPRSFYDAIPFGSDGDQVEETFTDIAFRLHKVESAIQMFFDSDIPKCKSMKRAFFSNMGLLFYMKECEALWHTIADVNIFYCLLKSDAIFNVLSILHQRPRLFEIVDDFARVKGTKALTDMLIYGWSKSISYAINYCTMNETMKKMEQNKWKTQETRFRFLRDDQFGDDDHEEYEEHEEYDDPLERNTAYNSPFSFPMKKPNKEIIDCVIDGFSFNWLRSGKDYLFAAKMLKNCLSGWTPTSNPVVVVSFEEKLVAAIEVGKRGIYQVHAARNTSISCVTGLPEAYQKWREHFGLQDAFRYMDEE